MNKKIYILLVAIITIVFVVILLAPKENKKQGENEKVKIVTSFYPIYVMAQNITDGAQGIELTNLTQNNVGCLHDYTLLTSDMKKVEKADIFIENGLDLENFMEKIIGTYPNLKIIDSSKNITNKIEDSEEGTNPHIWTSIENYMIQIDTITNDLSEYNPENANIYQENCNKYKEKLNDLKLKYDQELNDLKGKKVVCLDEALTYLIKEIGMECIQITTNHEESTLSADTIKNVINEIKNQNIKAIIVGEEAIDNAKTLEKETDAKIYKLDSCMSKNDNLDKNSDTDEDNKSSENISYEKDSYISSMQNNLEVLKQIIENS